MPDDYKRWFKRIAAALRLNRYDVVTIMALGGVSVSSSRTDGWFRRDDDDRGRAASMSHEQFDSFTKGLIEYMRSKQ